MALMIPADISEFKTEGEGRFYRFLENVAIPHNDYVVCYTPDINGKEPDFILFSRHAGLIIFEVKDWSLDQIRSADTRQFVLTMGTKQEVKKNPLYQAKDYLGRNPVSWPFSRSSLNTTARNRSCGNSGILMPLPNT